MLARATGLIKALLGSQSSKELAAGSVLLMVAKVLGALSGYLMAWLLASRGGAQAVGVYELAFTFIILLSVVSRFGLDGAIVRYIGVFSAQDNMGALRWLYMRSIKFSMIVSLVIALLLFVLAPWLGDLLGKGDLTRPLRWAAATIPLFTLINMNGETLRGFKKMLAYAALQQGTVVLLAALIFLLWWYPDLVGLSGVHAFFVASLLLVVISQLVINSRFKALPAEQEPEAQFKDIIKVAWPIFLSSSIFMLISWTDTLMIGYFMEESDVGLYRIAFRVSTVITFTQFAINGIAAPMIADLFHKGNQEGLRSLIHKIGLVNFLLSVPIFLIIIFFPGFLLGLFGQEFSEVSNLLLVLACGQVVFALSGPVMYILTMTKHEKVALNIMYITAAINLIGNAVLIPIYGLYGAAIATAFTTVLWNVLAVISVFRLLGVVSLPFIHRIFERNRGR